MDTLVSGWGRRYASNPRTLGISPRQLGTNPRALSRNPSVGTSADKHRVAAHRARAERVLSMYGIALCEPCEGTGWVETAAGMVRCQHQPLTIAQAEEICRRWGHYIDSKHGNSDAGNPYTVRRIERVLGRKPPD